MRSVVSRIVKRAGVERPTPLIVFGKLLVATLTVRCASNSDSNDGGSITGGGSGAQAGSGNGGAQGGVIPTGGTIQVIECSPSSVATDCPLPPSSCDADQQTLRYFTSPACVSGHCTFSTQTMRCPGNCFGGACLSSTTTTSISPPPPDPACVAGVAGNGNGGAAGSSSARTAGGLGGMSGSGGGLGTGGVGGVEDDGGVAGSGSGCPLPPSYCQDVETLVYFTN